LQLPQDHNKEITLHGIVRNPHSRQEPTMLSKMPVCHLELMKLRFIKSSKSSGLSKDAEYGTVPLKVRPVVQPSF
jgi:hypothetical protein